MLHRLARLWNDVLDFIYPPHCLVCAAAEHAPETPHLCMSCLKSLHDEALPAAGDLAEQFAERGQQKFFDDCQAAWPFSEKVQQLVHAMKYEHKPSIARLLAKGMSARIAPMNFLSHESVVIAPVSMHPRRQRERGYNQSALLANELAKLWAITVEANALRRVRDTPQQALLSAEERRRNVEDAFAVKKTGTFVGKTVLLIDDVVTTGSTINACAQALKTAGAVRVSVLAVARV